VSAQVSRRSGSRRLARLAVLLAVAAGLVAGWAGVGEAHPLGNFTVNTYSGLVVRPDSISVDFVVDMAEIPAYQTRQSGFICIPVSCSCPTPCIVIAKLLRGSLAHQDPG